MRSGTGWGMELSLQTVNAFKTRLYHQLRNVRGIYQHLLFSLPMAIHDSIFMDGLY